ncbi:MAG: extracellular solute-binding protein [Fimbriimonadaceae bacterium]|nr:extracellular solute-binding protein [Fimbriimonadaceae bacterium]
MRAGTWVACTTALVILGFGSACTPASHKTTVVVWGMALTPADKGTIDAIRAFEHANPDVEVRMLGLSAGRNNPQKLATAVAAGVPPDVVYQDRFALADWASRGAFESLSPLIERDRARDPLCPTPEQYYPATWRESQYGGDVYGIPWMADNRALYWNRTVFREEASGLRAAGLDPERPPRTWSELLAYSKVLTKFAPGGTLARAGFIPNFGNTYLYLYAFQNNAEFMSPDGTRCTLGSPEAVESLDFMRQGYRIVGGIDEANRFQATFRGEGESAFFVGQVAMVVDGDWTIPGIARFAPRLDFGTAPAPVPDDRFYHRGRFRNERDRFVTWTGGFAWCIPRGARNREAAWRFIKFVTSGHGREIRLEKQAELNAARGVPTLPSISAHIATNRLALERYVPAEGNLGDAVRTHVSLMSVARTRPVTYAGQLLWDEQVRATEEAIRGGVTPQEALDAAQARVQRRLNEFRDQSKFPLVDLRLPLALGGLGLAMGVALVWGWVRRQGLGKLSGHEARWGWLMVAPWLLGFVAFTAGPMLASLGLSFCQYDVLNPPRWVGFANFAEVLTQDNALLLKAFANVAYLGGIGVPLGLVTGLGLALLLNAGVKGEGTYRSLFYLPSIVPAVASAVLWMWVLNPDPRRGLANGLWVDTIGAWFSIPPPGWLVVEAWAKPSLIAMGVWGAGTGIIVWLAALKGVPRELYQSSSLDGAGPWATFWNITLPMISPLVFFSSVTGLIGTLQLFDSVYVVTEGLSTGPNDSLAVPVYLLFREAFHYFRIGPASAMAWIVFLAALLLTGAQFLIGRPWVEFEVDS